MKNILFLLSVLIVKITAAQNCQKWYDFQLNNAGIIAVPDCLEVQNEQYANAKLKDHSAMDVSLAKDRVVFQRKGVNATYKKPYKNTTFLIFSTKIGNAGAYPKVNSDKILTKDELQQLNSAILKTQSQIPQIQIIKFDQAKLVKIRDQNAIKVSYISKLKSEGNNEAARIITYMIPNFDRMHSINISYPLSDEAIWGPIFQNMVNSVYITAR